MKDALMDTFVNNIKFSLGWVQFILKEVDDELIDVAEVADSDKCIEDKLFDMRYYCNRIGIRNNVLLDYIQFILRDIERFEAEYKENNTES